MDTTQTDWQTWFQGIGSTVIGAATTAAYTQPYEIQKLQLAALGSNGSTYTEGKPQSAAPLAGVGTSTLLIAGALAVAALFFLKD